jgi:hypothetical protein
LMYSQHIQIHQALPLHETNGPRIIRPILIYIYIYIYIIVHMFVCFVCFCLIL